MKADEGQPFGLHDAGILLACRGGDIRRFFGEREWCDFDARVADFADSAAGVRERPFLKSFVADGLAEGQTTSLPAYAAQARKSLAAAKSRAAPLGGPWARSRPPVGFLVLT